MADTDDTNPGTSVPPAAEPLSETLESLASLRTIEEQRLADEATAEQAQREREAAARAEAERREREAAAERALQAEAAAEHRQRGEAAAAERAKLLDVERRLAEQERILRAEFDGERTRLTAELRAARSAFRRVAIPAAIVGISAVVFAIVIQARLGRAEQEQVRVLTTIERLERTVREIHDQHTAATQQAAVLERELIDARDRAARAEARVQELEAAVAAATARSHGPRRVVQRSAPPGRQRSRIPLIPSAISDDPLGPLVDDPPEERWGP